MKYFILLFIFFTLSCSHKRSSELVEELTQTVVEDKADDVREVADEEERETERERLTTKRNVIDAILSDRYTGVSSYDSYSGRACRKSQECMDICDDFDEKERCYRQPESLVRDMKEGLFDLINISEVDSVDISPGLFLGMLEIDKDLIQDLIEDQMSAGSIKSFLAWVAINRDISEALYQKDRSGTLLRSAFEELGDLQADSRNDVITGINQGLIGVDDTFLYLAADRDNDVGFTMVHRLVKQACSSSSECRKKVYCAREKQAQGRIRVAGFFRTYVSTCRTPSTNKRRPRNSQCYLHGSDVWSYLYNLVNSDDLNDSAFTETLSVEKCNQVCGSKDSDTCTANNI